MKHTILIGLVGLGLVGCTSEVASLGTRAGVGGEASGRADRADGVIPVVACADLLEEDACRLRSDCDWADAVIAIFPAPPQCFPREDTDAGAPDGGVVEDGGSAPDGGATDAGPQACETITDADFCSRRDDCEWFDAVILPVDGPTNCQTRRRPVVCEEIATAVSCIAVGCFWNEPGLEYYYLPYTPPCTATPRWTTCESISDQATCSVRSDCEWFDAVILPVDGPSNCQTRRVVDVCAEILDETNCRLRDHCDWADAVPAIYPSPPHCYVRSSEPSPVCTELLDQEQCDAAGCSWSEFVIEIYPPVPHCNAPTPATTPGGDPSAPVESP